MKRAYISYMDNEGSIDLPGGRRVPKAIVNAEVNKIVWDHAHNILTEGVEIYDKHIVVWYVVSRRGELEEKFEVRDLVEGILNDQGVSLCDEGFWPIAAQVKFPIPEDSYLYLENPDHGDRWEWDAESEKFKRIAFVRVGATVVRP